MPETVIPFQPKDENGNLLSMKTRTNTIYKPNGDPLGDDFLGTADIADNLTTQDPTKVLSAKQGAALNNTLAKFGKQLWSNSDTSQSFSPQTLQNIDTTNFTCYIVLIKYTTGYTMYKPCLCVKGGMDELAIHNDSGSDTLYTRTVTISNGQAVFSKAQKFVNANGVDDNSGAIPTLILGLF